MPAWPLSMIDATIYDASDRRPRERRCLVLPSAPRLRPRPRAYSVAMTSVIADVAEACNAYFTTRVERYA